MELIDNARIALLIIITNLMLDASFGLTPVIRHRNYFWLEDRVNDKQCRLSPLSMDEREAGCEISVMCIYSVHSQDIIGLSGYGK